MTDQARVEPSEHRQLASFVVTGGIAAGVNIAARWVLSWFLLYEVAVAIAYLFGMTSAFLLARTFVFEAGRRHWMGEFGRFAIVNAVSFLVVLGVSAGLARLFFPAIGYHWHAEDVAHVIGVVSPILLSFYAHKHFSFGAPREEASHG